jgi:hypothetical protein
MNATAVTQVSSSVLPDEIKRKSGEVRNRDGHSRRRTPERSCAGHTVAGVDGAAFLQPLEERRHVEAGAFVHRHAAEKPDYRATFCGHAVSGQAVAAPRPVMNSRRLVDVKEAQ